MRAMPKSPSLDVTAFNTRFTSLESEPGFVRAVQVLVLVLVHASVHMHRHDAWTDSFDEFRKGRKD